MSPLKTQGEYTKRKAAKALFGLPSGLKESPEQRTLLAHTLERSSNPQIKQLVTLAYDPVYANASIVRLMEICHISYQEVGREFQALMRTEGLIRQATHLPDLMEQTAVDARSSTVECLACDGGFILAPVQTVNGTQERKLKCKQCRGTGQVRQLGDLDRLKLVFETTGLIGKGGGINLIQNLDLRQMKPDEAVEDVVATVGKIIDAATGELLVVGKSSE